MTVEATVRYFFQLSAKRIFVFKLKHQETIDIFLILPLVVSLLTRQTMLINWTEANLLKVTHTSLINFTQQMHHFCRLYFKWKKKKIQLVLNRKKSQTLSVEVSVKYTLVGKIGSCVMSMNFTLCIHFSNINYLSNSALFRKHSRLS